MVQVVCGHRQRLISNHVNYYEKKIIFQTQAPVKHSIDAIKAEAHQIVSSLSAIQQNSQDQVFYQLILVHFILNWCSLKLIIKGFAVITKHLAMPKQILNNYQTCISL